MGETIIEKIIRHNTGKAVKPGDIVTVNVDRVMIHDIFIPFVAEKFEEMGFTKLHDPDKVVLIYDHLVPASQQDDTRHFRTGDAFADKYGLTHVHRSDGICHQLMTEAGYVKPGDTSGSRYSHSEPTAIPQLMVVLEHFHLVSVIPRWQVSLEPERCGSRYRRRSKL